MPQCINVNLNPDLRPIGHNHYQVTTPYYYNSDTLVYENGNYQISERFSKKNTLEYAIKDVDGVPVKFKHNGKTFTTYLEGINSSNMGVIYSSDNDAMGIWYIEGGNLYRHSEIDNKTNMLLIIFGLVLLIMIVFYIMYNKNY